MSIAGPKTDTEGHLPVGRTACALVQTTQTKIIDISQQVTALQARLSSSNQNDVALAMQDITSRMAAMQAQLNDIALTVSGLQQG
jgi:hypothetical protein